MCPCTQSSPVNSPKLYSYKLLHIYIASRSVVKASSCAEPRYNKVLHTEKECPHKIKIQRASCCIKHTHSLTLIVLKL